MTDHLWILPKHCLPASSSIRCQSNQCSPGSNDWITLPCMQDADMDTYSALRIERLCFVILYHPHLPAWTSQGHFICHISVFHYVSLPDSSNHALLYGWPTSETLPKRGLLVSWMSRSISYNRCGKSRCHRQPGLGASGVWLWREHEKRQLFSWPSVAKRFRYVGEVCKTILWAILRWYHLYSFSNGSERVSPNCQDLKNIWLEYWNRKQGFSFRGQWSGGVILLGLLD